MKDINKYQQTLLAFLRRYNLVIFIVVVFLLLTVAVLILSNVAAKAGGTDVPPQSGVSTSFDQETIDRIEKLKTSDQPSDPLNLSQGRIDPFSE